VNASAGTTANRPAPVYLADLPETDVRGSFAKKVTTGEFRIMVNGVPSPNGLWMHPPTYGSSQVSYVLGKKYHTFKATAAINDSVKSTGAATGLIFKVRGDGKELWKSGQLKAKGASQQFTISVTDIDRLELEVHCPDSDSNAHAVWVEPQLWP
jgi:hypothetical protein